MTSTDENRPWLFVYGSLRRGQSGAFAAPERARLYKRARWVGTARMAGRLLDLGDYPGLIEGPGTDGQVTGDLLCLHRPVGAVFHWLDPFEGIRPGLATSQYRRVRRTVLREAGEPVDAWVYVLRQMPRAPRVVAGGDWLTW